MHKLLSSDAGAWVFPAVRKCMLPPASSFPTCQCAGHPCVAFSRPDGAGIPVSSAYPGILIMLVQAQWVQPYRCLTLLLVVSRLHHPASDAHCRLSQIYCWDRHGSAPPLLVRYEIQLRRPYDLCRQPWEMTQTQPSGTAGPGQE